MLLGIMRKHAKSWLIKCLIGIIAVVFIFYFGYSFTAKQGLKVAFVNGDLISSQEYQKAYYDLLEALQRQYKAAWNDNLIKVFDLKNKALNNLINRKLISQEAKRLGLDVTEIEAQKAIMDYPPFKVNGQFDKRLYRSILNRNRMNPEDFEADIGQDLLEKKLKQFLFSFIEVTDQEILDYYTYSNEKIKIDFVQFKPDKFKESLKLDQISLEKFFDKNKEKYRVPEKVKITYLEIDPEVFKAQVKIGDKDIKDYYDFNIDIFRHPKQVKASHILFKLARDAAGEEEKKVKERAEAVLEKARQGDDFSALAKEYSEGPTKSGGGDLGYFSAGKMDKSFEEAAFKLKINEISDLVRTPFGYHIIWVEDIKEAETKTMDEVRDQIIDNLFANTSGELAHEKGLSLIDQMPYDIDLGKYAAEHELKAKHTGYISKDENIPGIEDDKKLRQSLFSLEKNGTSELIELEGKFYIFQVSDRKASYLPEFKEVVDKVEKDYIPYLMAEEAKKAAETYLAELHKGESWDKLAESIHLKSEETNFFSRKDSIPGIGYAPALHESAFSLDTNKRYPDKIFENEKGAFVIRWEASEGIDKEKYQKEKQQFRFSLMQAKHKRFFEKWLENLKKNAEIEIVTPVDSTR